MKNLDEKAAKLLITFYKLNLKYDKLYCYPSQLTILALVSEYQNLSIGIATLNRRLKAMEEIGCIIRTRRISRHKKKGIIFKSTLYKITVLGYHMLKVLGISVYKQIERLMREGMKYGHKTLGAFRGPTHISRVLASMTCFGMKQKRYILEK